MPFRVGSTSRAISAVFSKAAFQPKTGDQQKRRALGPPFFIFGLADPLETIRLARNIGIFIAAASANCSRAGSLGRHLCASRPPGSGGSGRLSALLGPSGLDGIPDPPLQADAVEAVDLLKARGRGDVDLGHVIPDHVDA